MEGSVLSGPMLSGPGAGVLELDPPLHHPTSLHHHQQPLTHLHGLAPLSTTQHVSQDSEQSLGLDSKGTPKASFFGSKGKSAGTSDEDEPSFTEDGADGHLGGKSKKNSTWQRMKWTDNMVKLLINVVLFVGEDGTVDICDGNNKRKSGILQKKGKWKSVSRVMLERGCYVSPQQCEDKFNDLNKRYKRLNDILGKGTACSVVENPCLLDTMDNLTPKMKEDIKKILSSKHLFYKEMCSYHSGCKAVVSADLEFHAPFQGRGTGKHGDPVEEGRLMKGENDMEDEDEDDVEEEDEEDDYDGHDDENGGDAEADAVSGLPSPFSKRRKSLKYCAGNFGSLPGYAKNIGLEPMNNELMQMMHEGSKLTPEQRQSMRTQALQLEEQKVCLQSQALELEKRRFNWQRLDGKKNRELERMRLENERMKLENERMSLQLKQKELEIEFKRSEASMTSIALILDRVQSKEQKDLGRGQGLG